MSCCPYCGRSDEGNPGDYYHHKDCEARALREKLAEAERACDEEAIQELREALERARYVGD